MNYERSPFECLTHNYRGGRPCPYCVVWLDGQDRERRTDVRNRQISDTIDDVVIRSAIAAALIMSLFAWWRLG